MDIVDLYIYIYLYRYIYVYTSISKSIHKLGEIHNKLKPTTTFWRHFFVTLMLYYY